MHLRRRIIKCDALALIGSVLALALARRGAVEPTLAAAAPPREHAVAGLDAAESVAA